MLQTRSDLEDEHGVRAIEHSRPLIGCGDWNDGMNRVGEDGRGESVWVGFFDCEEFNRFAEVARLHQDEPFAIRCESEVARPRATFSARCKDDSST